MLNVTRLSAPDRLTGIGTLTPAALLSGISARGPVNENSVAVEDGCPTGVVKVNAVGLVPRPVKATESWNWMFPPQGKAGLMENVNGVVFDAVAPGAMFGIADAPLIMTTPGVEVVSVAVTAVAVAPPSFSTATTTDPVPPGWRDPPPDPVMVFETKLRKTAGFAPTCCNDSIAETTPWPLCWSLPCASMSRAAANMAARIFAAVAVGTADLRSAATAPACGAAAEVPKNGFRPLPEGRVVLTPSAALRSGLKRVSPPPLPKVTPPRIGRLLRL